MALWQAVLPDEAMHVKGIKEMKKTVFATSLVLLTASGSFAQESGLNDGHLTALDADGDASISSSEFKAFTDFAFQSIDVNKDGSLSRAEVLDHADADAFSRVDADGNGTVSRSEFEARMDANFKAADQDGDGVLN